MSDNERAIRQTFLGTIAVCALCTAVLCDAPFLRAEGEDQRALATLRERRQFQLAEEFCRKQLAAPKLSEIERTEWMVELVITLAMRGVNAPPAERAKIWQQVNDEVTNFRRRQPPSPRQILVDVQGALAALARAEQTRQELETGPVPPLPWRRREELRGAIKQLQALREEATRLVRLRNRQPAIDPADLTAKELRGVQQHLHFQLARAWRSLAESFPEDSADSMALQQAIEELKPLAVLDGDHPQLWEARLEDVVCRRLLKDKGTNDKLTSLRGASPPPRIQLRALGEGIRIAIASGDFELAEKWAGEGKLISATAAEFDFARLELQIAKSLAATKRKDEAAARAAQDSAAKIAAEIDTGHGLYWSRKAQSLLAGIAGSGAQSNLDVLAAAAAQHLRLRRFGEAIAAYDQAATQARAAKAADRAFSFGWAAAAIEYQEQHWPAAQQRFLRLASDFPQHAQGAEAHWNGVTCAALVARAKSPPLLDEYVALLEEHLEKWPAGPTADKARWWLGQTRQSQRRWNDAARAFAGISAMFADYPLAIRRWGECVERHIREEQASGKLAPEAAAKVIAEFESRYVIGDGMLPAKWDAAQSEAAIAAARLRLRWKMDAAEETARQLSALVRASPDLPSAAAARRWLMVALAAGGKSDEARQLLVSLPDAAPAEWLALTQALAVTSRAAPDTTKKSVAEVRLAILARIDPQLSSFAAEDQLAIRRDKIDALLLAGKKSEGLTALESLAKSLPDDGQVQQQLAELYEGADDAASLEKALAQWRLVVARSSARSERWYRASLGAVNSLHRQGKKLEAKQAIEILIARPPGLEKTSLKKEFLDLLRKCGG